jgi:hypothetical protein
VTTAAAFRSPVTRRRLSRVSVRRSGVRVFSGALLIVAATVMPFATYRDVSARTTTTFRGGSLGIVLAGLGAVSITLALVSRNRCAPWLERIHVAVGWTALVLSIVLALTKIQAANEVLANGTSETSYAFGSLVAIAASAMITLISLVALAATKRVRASPTT